MTRVVCAVVLAALIGCGDDSGNGGNGDAGGSDTGGGSDAEITTDGTVQQQCGTLHAVIRDFKIAHPDFEIMPPNDVVIPGIVAPTITPGGKPKLATPPNADDQIQDATTFSQWYTDVADVNQKFEQDFLLDETPPGSGTFVYDKPEYFPIDNEGFGNEGNAHNYHFTTELHASFTYKGGEVFTFRGDDDVWVYVNGKLAIDIGGIHSANERTINFDAQAAALGISVNNTYAIDFFQAERHVTGSSFKITTSIACFVIL